MSTLEFIVRTRGWKLGAGVALGLVGALFAAGCKTGEFSSYISPRVTGQVIEADTHQPLGDVQIRRVDPDANQDFDQASKGGQIIERTAPVTTDRHGKFVMEAERDLTLLRHSTWYSVTLSFKREGYLSLQTNYTIAAVTGHAPDGAPIVNAGQICLRPLNR